MGGLGRLQVPQVGGRVGEEDPQEGGSRGGRGAGGRGGRGRGGGGRGGTKARRWTFTINNYKGVPASLPSNMRYLCFGKEVGKENGTPHLQGFVEFKNPVYCPSKYFDEYGKGHFEKTRGSVKDNTEYCSKEGDFTEFGRRPVDRRSEQGHHGAKGGQMEIARWEAALQAAKEGRMDDIPADIYTRYYNTYLKIAARHQAPPEELENLDNLWIVGPHGCGKSTWAHRTYPGCYKKGFSKWWDGYREEDAGHKVVLLDDLHPKWSEKEMLKNWGDKFPSVAEIKGGSMVIRPEKIIVTSNYQPSECFGEKDLGPILRRFKVVTMDDLPPAPPKKKAVPTANPEIPELDEVEEGEFDPEVQQVLLENQAGGEGSVGMGGSKGSGGGEGGEGSGGVEDSGGSEGSGGGVGSRSGVGSECSEANGGREGSGGDEGSGALDRPGLSTQEIRELLFPDHLQH